MVTFYQPQKKRVPSNKFTVTIDDLDSFGQGIVRNQGKTNFVKSALPNETVDIVLTEDKKQYAKANVIKYYNQSSERVTPICRYYQICGGCEMQHLSISLQRKTKLNTLITLLQKETGQTLSHFNDSERNIIADSPYYYRRRARLSINFVKNELMIGFRKAESNQIITVEHCAVLVKELDALLIPAQRCLNQIKQKKVLGHAELISTESGIILILRHIQPFTETDLFLLRQLAERENLSLYLHGEKLIHLSGKTEHYYLVDLGNLTLKLTFSPLDFIQVNSNINQKMIDCALTWLDLTENDCVLDLFCGMGNFSLPLATRCKSVMGIEGIQALVDNANLNISLNTKDFLTGDIHFFVGDLEHDPLFSKWDEKKKPSIKKFNKVLLDPARAGAAFAITEIVKTLPDRIVYISCNPVTLARDSKLLTDAGYTIARITILDMFPQTKHVESMLLFIKSGS